MTQFFIHVSAGTMLVFSVCFFLIFGLAGSLVIRKILGADSLKRSSELAGILFNAVVVFYSVLAAFVVIAEWEDFEEAGNNISLEASSLADLRLLASSIDQSTAGKQILSASENYLNDVLNVEWPAMKTEMDYPGQSATLEKLKQAVMQFEPVSEKEKIMDAGMQEDIEQINDCRHIRYQAQTHLPTDIWIVLIAGSIILLVFMWFLYSENLKRQLFLNGLVCVLLALIIFSCVALDHPLRGMSAIQPTVFEQLKMGN